MDFDYGFDDETNETFIILEDGEILYFDEVPQIIGDLIDAIISFFQ